MRAHTPELHPRYTGLPGMREHNTGLRPHTRGERNFFFFFQADSDNKLGKATMSARGEARVVSMGEGLVGASDEEDIG